MGLKIQANGPQKAQANAILEKVFTAITKVVLKKFTLFLCYCVSSMQHAAQHSVPLVVDG